MTDAVGPVPDPVEVGPSPPGRAAGRSLRAGSASRLVAEVAFAASALGASIIISRALGPHGKGVVTTISYLVAALAPSGFLGVGEASVVLLGSGRATVSQAVAVTLRVLAVAVPASVALVVAVSWFVFGSERWWDLGSVLPFAAGTSLFFALSMALSPIIESQVSVVASSAIRFITAALIAACTMLLVGFLGLGASGGVAASMIGWMAGAVGVVVLLRRHGHIGGLKVPAGLLRAALRIALPVQASYLLVVLAGRVDLLIVSGVLGDDAAGLYSVSLTAGQLVGYPAIALSAASFPRLADATSKHTTLAAEVVRAGLVTSGAVAVAVAIVLPVAVPLTFGSGFQASVAPGLLLVVAGLLNALQWLVCRILAARGAVTTILRSYGLNVLVMVLLDVALVERWGLIGAALAAVAAGGAGLARAMVGYRRSALWPGWAMLVPRLTDVRRLVSLVSRIAALSRHRRS